MDENVISKRIKDVAYRGLTEEEIYILEHKNNCLRLHGHNPVSRKIRIMINRKCYRNNIYEIFQLLDDMITERILQEHGIITTDKAEVE